MNCQPVFQLRRLVLPNADDLPVPRGDAFASHVTQQTGGPVALLALQTQPDAANQVPKTATHAVLLEHAD